MTCSAPPLRDRDGDGWITVVCVGDSNTRSGTYFPAEEGWCELLGARLGPPWRTVDRGRNGATACHTTRVPPPTEPPWEAAPLLAEALQHDAPDAVVLAFGTNDAIYQCAPEAVVEAYRQLLAEARAASVVALVALAPPIVTPGNERTVADLNRHIAEVNRRLRQVVPAADLVDFATGMEALDYLPDGLHLGPSGQRKRADAAAAVLLSRAGATISGSR